MVRLEFVFTVRLGFGVRPGFGVRLGFGVRVESRELDWVELGTGGGCVNGGGIFWNMVDSEVLSMLKIPQ
eukprot:TRINITY_DN1835_c0_g2_i1.p2 TRINITY_DN1835_c0_g2~~TRINITY_DN1835_c0_g2_i1.p2  ORF type:complete len:70 (-),score=9.72 TRINITY_DN1835_c0_g2_i1:272-481(-)